MATANAGARNISAQEMSPLTVALRIRPISEEVKFLLYCLVYAHAHFRLCIMGFFAHRYNLGPIFLRRSIEVDRSRLMRRWIKQWWYCWTPPTIPTTSCARIGTVRSSTCSIMCLTPSPLRSKCTRKQPKVGASQSRYGMTHLAIFILIQLIQLSMFPVRLLPSVLLFCLGLISWVVNGYNATVFAYGATGCGKTYTMLGNEDSPGIMARTLNDLFLEMNRNADNRYQVTR